ncbi:MAG TPA: hypothetical protein VGR95_03775 [Thermoanaerobaculia bacterium]|jgi:hypothetical protein|nr:hypothetical protein [Thermoanaerobaculia bacterium]
MKKLLLIALVFAAGTAAASTIDGFGMNVLMGDEMRPEYAARGKVYVEAVRGADYSIRLTNPTPYRVAVALSVDGLNTIDAKHTTPWSASKWILAPYESTVIAGWQVNDQTARRFFFTGENRSYGAYLGQTDNLGVIEAVFYRERRPKIQAQSPRIEEKSRDAQPSAAAGSAAPSDEYAATGMGGRTTHEVEMVDIDLDSTPAARVTVRYEFHPQLVRLGLLPQLETPLDRREHARGFGGYCPEPK